MKLRLYVLIAALAYSLSSHAEYYSGNDLLHDMAGSTLEKALAMGYVMGVAEAIRTVLDVERIKLGKPLIPSFCIPVSGLPRQQVNDIVRKYLLDNPASRHEPAEAQVYGALGESFPCPNK